MGAAALVGLAAGALWTVTAAFATGQTALAALSDNDRRAREDDPVFVDRPPRSRRRPRAPRPRLSSKAARTRADSWLLIEHLLSAKGGSPPAPVPADDPTRYAIVSERSMVPLERFATLAEADRALGGVRRQAPTLGARLLVVDLAQPVGARGIVRGSEGDRMGSRPEARGATGPTPADTAR
jgi:hypothetical protein